MTAVRFNTDPTELTSFDGGSSPDQGGNIIRHLLDFVRRSSSVVGDDIIVSPHPTPDRDRTSPALEGPAVVRRITPFESVFQLTSGRPNMSNWADSKSDSESHNDFKKYWMPDDQCKECYECGTTFTTFKRRHHCRLCGQIFCYDCCSDTISGKIAGYGDAEVQLRVCKYCLERKSKHQKIDRKRSNHANKPGLMFSSPTLDSRTPEPESPNNDHFNEFLQEELKEEDVQKINQHFLWSLFRSPSSSVSASPAWVRFRYFAQTYSEDHILAWLRGHLTQKTDEADAMLEAWIESSRLEPINPKRTLFKVGSKDDFNENTVLLYEQIKKEPESCSSTNWIHRMIQEARASSAAFDLQGSTSSYVHVDLDKDLDEEYWQSSETALNTSQSLDEVGMELKRVIDSMNCTVQLISNADTPAKNDSSIKSAEHHGIEMLNECIRQEKTPATPILNIPPFSETPDADTGEARSYERKAAYLNEIYEDHMDCILDTLIDKEKVPSEWRGILKRLVREAANDVSPNPSSGDSMDIRKYVKFKKLNGRPEDSAILDGYVFTKTVAHKKMKTDISNPKIMLMNGSISYQRVLNKLTSLNPVFLQEKEHLTKVVDRVASFGPDVLIVEKSVSQIAKDELLQKGITLILNLKQGQVERIARSVQGDIIQNLENITFIANDDVSASKNKLGHCKEFRADFAPGFHGSHKPLLYFSGCNKSLIKTILLRGDNKHVLKRVKKIASYYLYAMYNKRLEFHYLKRSQLYWRTPHANAEDCPGDESLVGTPTAGFSMQSASMLTVSASPSILSLTQERLANTPESCLSMGSDVMMQGTSPSVNRSSQQGGHLADDGISLQGGHLADDGISLPSDRSSTSSPDDEQLFENLVSSTLFSVTPFCRPPVPYLCTEAGSTCPARAYFDEQIYHSNLLTPGATIDEDPLSEACNLMHGDSDTSRSVSPSKPMTISLSTDDVAYFRAFGHWEFERGTSEQDDEVEGQECHPHAPYHIQNRFEANLKGKELDCLDFYSHQKLLVLFSSLSVKSFNHPHPCISPWSLSMQFYGKNDLTLGLFLRDYCYQSTYQCPEQACKTDIVDHERRFVHDGQCIILKMSKLPAVLESIVNTPIMWSVCNKCLHVSKIGIVSKETWNLSFAKFLEMKFYERCLYVKGPCPHTFHRYHSNFFVLGNIVACFSRADVNIAEVCPLPCRYSFKDKFTDIAVSNGVLLNETVTKINIAFKAVHDKIEALTGCEEGVVKETRAKAVAEDSSFKANISELSHSLIQTPIEIRREIHKIQSDLVFSIDSWNKYLAEVKRRPKASPKTPISASSEILNVLSESEDNPLPVATISSLSKGSAESFRSSVSGDKTHRRVLSDGYITIQKRAICRNHSEVDRALSRSVDNLSEGTEVKLCETDRVWKQHESKPGLKNSESRYSKMASKTKKLFAALTESYKKIEVQFPSEEHHRITGGSRPTVLVSERRFTSIIAYALSCEQYRAKLQLLKPDTEQSRPPVRKASHNKSYSTASTFEGDDRVGHWLTVTSNSSDHNGETKGPSHKRQKSTDFSPSGDAESVINKSSHVDIEFHDGATKFFCKIYFAAEFDKLRSMLMPGEALSDFIHSLSYCNKWRAKGGKSGLAFSKTQDDRWVVKEMSRLELQALLMFMPHYCEYITDSIDKRPTLLAKIIGACTVGFNNTYSGISMKQDVIIMENIFYNASPTLVYDLKGSVRNRLAEEGEEVLLDENYLHHIVDKPVFLRPHSKTFLREAVNCDTAFLAAQSIIDYSLLVGMCGDRIVVGIIDYIRKFTFDKKVEMIFKTNMIGSAGRMPTIVSPEMYRERFCNQIERYFPLVPDKWTGMGSDLQYS